MPHCEIKSDNLHFNTLGRWFIGTNDSSTKCLMFQVHIIFFHKFLHTSLQKSFQFIFIFFYNFTKIKIKTFMYPKSVRNHGKKWCLEHHTLGHWVIPPIDPACQRIILKIVGILVSRLVYLRPLIHCDSITESLTFGLRWACSTTAIT